MKRRKKLVLNAKDNFLQETIRKGGFLFAKIDIYGKVWKINDMKPFITNLNGTITTLILINNECDREDYVYDVLEWLYQYLFELGQQPNGAISKLIGEMIKNTYDHGNGAAVIVLDNQKNYLDVDFIDLNPVKVDYITLSKGDNWVRKSDRNYGVGLNMIQTMGNVECERFVISDENGGIDYSFRFVKVNKKATTLP
jgi:hypothetical protein